MKKLLSTLLFLPLLASCTTKNEVRGHVLDENSLKMIKPNVSTKQDVESILGSPDTKSLFGKENWYYIQYNARITPFSNPTPTYFDYSVVEFDKKGKVAQINNYKHRPFNNIKIVTETTPVKGKNDSLISDFVSNIGRFSSPNKNENKQHKPTTWD